MTSIEWTQQTWNPTIGCSKISAGCKNCYAINQACRNWEMAKALPEERRGRLAYYEGLTEKHGSRIEWTGKIAFAPEALDVPLKRKKPTTYFVNSMSDLFHECGADEWIDQIFAVMALTPQHTYQILTKRPDRMLEYFNKTFRETVHDLGVRKQITRVHRVEAEMMRMPQCPDEGLASWPLPNVWLGVSVEDQKAADERIPCLLATPASVRFLSCEPLLGELQIEEYLRGIDYAPGMLGYQETSPGIDWLICGAESGAGARSMDEDWVRLLRDQCQDSGVAFFYKQNFVNGRKISLPELDGRQWMEMPG